MKRTTQALQHVTTWRAADMSQAEYCRQQGINPKTFSAWVRNESRLDKRPPLEVIPVQVTPSTEAVVMPTPLTLRFKHGMQLELSTAVSPRWLAELLQCLV
jgi:hypothetical protein